VRKFLRASFIYRILASVYAWFGVQWRESRIVSRFLAPVRKEPAGGILYRISQKIHMALCFVFEKLRLTKVFNGSIFSRCYLWCAIGITLAPVLPTMALLVLAVLSFAAFIIQFGCDREKKVPYSPVNKYIVLYAFIYIVATFTSVNVMGSLKGGLLTVLFVLFAVILQSAVQSKKQFDLLFYLMVAAGTVVSLYGLMQYVFGAAGAENWVDEEMFGSVTRVYSTLENPNVLAEYLLIVIPMAFAGILAGKGKLKKVIFALCFAVMALCMILTFSRGGWLGLLVAAAVFLIMLDRRFILLGIVGLIAMYFVLPDSILNRFLSIGDLGDSSTSYRVAIWMGTIAMLKDYWLCGIGPGVDGFNKIYPIYSYNAATAQHSHNLFLQITCDAGICGIVIFLAILFKYFRTAASAVSRETDKKSRYFQIASVSSMCGFLVQSMTDYSFYNYRVMFLFWVLVAFGIIAARRSELTEDRLW